MIGTRIIKTGLLGCVLGLSACATTEPQEGVANEQKAIAAPDTAAPEVNGIIVDSTDPFDVLEDLIAARAAYSDRDFKRAANAYQTVLLHDPKLFEARLGFAESLYALGQVRRAQETLGASSRDTSEKFSDRSARLHLLLDSHLDPSDQAAEALQVWINKHPEDLRLYIRLAQLHDHNRDWAEARAVYSKALSIDPDHAPLRNNFGMSLLAQGRTDLAARQFERASASAPGNRLYENNLRLVQLLGGDGESALSDLSATRQAALLTDAASFLKRSGQSETAKKFYEDAIKVDPSYNATAMAELVKMKPDPS